MLRVSTKLHGTARKKIASFLTNTRSQSTQAGTGGGTGFKVALAGGATLVAGIGSVVTYASLSNENRKAVEGSVPGSGYVFEQIFGPLVEKKPISKAPAVDVGLLQKKLDREKEQKEKAEKEKNLEKLSVPKETKSPKVETKSAPPPPLTAPAPSVPPPPPLVEAKKTVEEKKTPDSAKIAPVVKKEVEIVPDENELLAKKLDACLTSAKKHVSDAHEAAEEAAKTIRVYAEKAYAAVESDDSQGKLYAVAAELGKLKSEMVKAAEDKVNKATQSLGELEKEVQVGRKNEKTRRNPVINAAEDALSELSFVISRINNVMAEALRDSSVVADFKDLVESSRKQFEMEVKSLRPDMQIGNESGELTSDEMNLLLAHAHKKVLVLQKALARLQTIEKERIASSAETPDRNLQVELDRQRHDLQNEHRHRLNELREDLESEMRTQLKRQAAAHSEHLGDVLEAQQKDLALRFDKDKYEAVQKEKDQYCNSLSHMRGEVDGLKSAVKARSEADKAAYAAHELWLACESLQNALRLGKESAASWHDPLVPLEKQVDVIRKAAGSEDNFVHSILSTLPSLSLQRGVYTEEALRERFIKVETVCRRVAMVGEEGGSLLRYFLSYLQSFLIVSAFDSLPGKELRDEEVDVDSLTAFDILARARYCLNKDDLVMALRYMCLLKGEPRHVSKDWREEVRLTLEAKQAAEAVRAHAAAQGARAL